MKSPICTCGIPCLTDCAVEDVAERGGAEAARGGS